MQLSEYLDVEKLERYVTEGIVERRYHRTLPLTIYCYSRRATFENLWDDVTTKTRGLIVDAQGTVVARPFEKFFNIDTLDRPETHVSNLPIDVQPVVLDKLDGSLGTIWRYGSFTGIASKGSFQSDHANWANVWYERNCPNPIWPEGYTPQVEMICQSVQRHVVSYDMPDQCVLLALINNETGEELPYNDLYHYAYLNGMKTVDIFSKSVGDVLLEDRENREGYVLSYPRPGQTPLKIKVKHETFLRLQKVMHSISIRAIYESVSEGRRDVLRTWVDQTTPEMAKLIQYWVGKFYDTYARTLLSARNHFLYASELDTRKDFAEYVNTKAGIYAPLVFGLLDNKDIQTMAWKITGDIHKDDLGLPLVTGDPEDDEDERV